MSEEKTCGNCPSAERVSTLPDGVICVIDGCAKGEDNIGCKDWGCESISDILTNEEMKKSEK